MLKSSFVIAITSKSNSQGSLSLVIVGLLHSYLFSGYQFSSFRKCSRLIGPSRSDSTPAFGPLNYFMGLFFGSCGIIFNSSSNRGSVLFCSAPHGGGEKEYDFYPDLEFIRTLSPANPISFSLRARSSRSVDIARLA